MMRHTELIPHLFRTEYSKIVAVLYHSFDLRHLEIAEDIASDTFLKAAEVWGIKGVPENPAAWLYAVAKNKTKDYFKHQSVFENKIKPIIGSDKMVTEPEFDFNERHIADSQLAMIFAVCKPGLRAESQICLALQILCGFSVEEIANAFLTKPETIKKRLHRARTTLRDNQFQIKMLSKIEIQTRLDVVLKTLYLLFNEGYFSKTNDQLIRKDLCVEAMRLAFILSENPLTNTAETNALLALMCFQSSRFDARTNDHGEAVLIEEQDKSLWNTELIEKGNQYIALSCKGDTLSKYHLEAAIAYWHTTSAADHKWPCILQLYNELVLLEYSPITALNRTFAFAKVYGHEKAIEQAKKLNLDDHNSFHSLLGYLYAPSHISEAISHYNKALALTKSEPEKQTLRKEINRLSGKTTSSTK
jgi:RNA polymerase sigma-70 factor (ECF subfamily)